MSLSHRLSSAWAIILPGLVTALFGLAASAIALAVLWGAALVEGRGFAPSGPAARALDVVGSEAVLMLLAVYLASFGLSGLNRRCDELITALFSALAFLLGFLSGFTLILLVLDPALGLLGRSLGGTGRLQAEMARDWRIYLAALLVFPVIESIVRDHAGRGLRRAAFILASLAAAVGMVIVLG